MNINNYIYGFMLMYNYVCIPVGKSPRSLKKSHGEYKKASVTPKYI